MSKILRVGEGQSSGYAIRRGGKTLEPEYLLKLVERDTPKTMVWRFGELECPECESNVELDDSFCRFCGQSLEQPYEKGEAND